MAITHSNFLTQVRNYTEVSNNVLSDSQIQEFIRNVELDIAGKVDYDELRKYANSNFTAANRAGISVMKTDSKGNLTDELDYMQPMEKLSDLERDQLINIECYIFSFNFILKITNTCNVTSII